MDRDSRRIQNTKQPSLEFTGKPSLHSMVEGQMAIQKKSNTQLAIYRKKFGQLWKSFMSNNGDQYVERTLTSKILKYTHKFVDYRVFVHNFTDGNISDTHYLGWGSVNEDDTGMDKASNAYLTPFNMTCHKILFRPETLSNSTTDITFTVIKQDDGDTTTDTVASFQYNNISSDTLATINESDFNTSPKVEAGDKVGLKLVGSADASGTIDWYITSVWRVEIEI